MRTRAFLPPPTCSMCANRPVLGESLIHTGEAWICAACLTDQQSGRDVMTKIAPHAIEADFKRSRARRVHASGDTEGVATELERSGQWHWQAAASMKANGDRRAQGTVVAHGEAIPRKLGYLKDTLDAPDLVAIESSEERGRLLLGNDIVALGLDVANTARASNTHEKLIAHEIALAHKVAMDQARRASNEMDPKMELRRLQVSARMMAMAQQGVITLQRLQSGGTQNVVVQHVHVEAGGQAVVGVQTGNRQRER